MYRKIKSKNSGGTSEKEEQRGNQAIRYLNINIF